LVGWLPKNKHKQGKIMAIKVGEISVTNFKKIKSLDVQANGGNVFIMGKNGTGKTTLIQALYCLLTGKELPPDPITIGEHRSEISTTLFNDMTKAIVCIAKLVITEKHPKGKLTVTTEDGRDVPGGPRTFLDKLTENLLFDPFDFLRMTEKAQVKFLKDIIGVNFDALDKEHKEIWDKRAEVNRDVKNLKGANESTDIQEHEVRLFSKKKDVEQVKLEIGQADKTNREYKELKDSIDKLSADITTNSEGVEQLKHKAQAVVNTVHAYANIKEYLVILKTRAEELGANDFDGQNLITELAAVQKLIDNIAAKEDIYKGRVEEGKKKVDEDKLKLADLETQFKDKKEVSVEQLNKTFQEYIMFNQKCDKVHEYSGRLLQIDEKENLSKQYTERLAEIHQERLNMISNKGIPAGLSIDFEKECLTYEGLAFDETQMSKSKIIAIGIELMMSTNPQLRICRIKDGSLLDTETMDELISIINEQDFQAFVELVSPEKQGLEVSVQEV
jgi:DNA repair exonuclease SbcCD ATPase subunit